MTLPSECYDVDLFGKIKKFKTFNLTLAKNMGKGFTILRILKQNRPFFVKLRAVQLIILIHRLLYRSA